MSVYDRQDVFRIRSHSWHNLWWPTDEAALHEFDRQMFSFEIERNLERQINQLRRTVILPRHRNTTTESHPRLDEFGRNLDEFVDELEVVDIESDTQGENAGFIQRASAEFNKRIVFFAMCIFYVTVIYIFS